MVKSLKKSIGVGGAYKNDSIEIHGEHIEKVSSFLSNQNIKFKKTGG